MSKYTIYRSMQNLRCCRTINEEFDRKVKEGSKFSSELSRGSRRNSGRIIFPRDNVRAFMMRKIRPEKLTSTQKLLLMQNTPCEAA